MYKILENQILEVEHLLSYRGSMKETELQELGIKLEKKATEAGAKRVAFPITATYGGDGNTIDMELLLPIDKKIEVVEPFKYKDCIKINNAVVLKYIGHPKDLKDACNELNLYIMQHGLTPITVGYNVTRYIKPIDLENTEIDIFVGITSNIL